jgi:hypothetical protein
MNKRFIFTLLICGLFHQADAQFDTSFIKFNIKRCADSLTDAFKAREWEKFTRYSYPALVGSMGGKKEFADYISTNFSHIPDTCWKKYEPTKILQVLRTEGDYQAVILLSSVLEWENTRYVTTTPLIAESWDGGYFWTFFDSQGDPIATKIVKPDLSPLIQIPERKEMREAISY